MKIYHLNILSEHHAMGDIIMGKTKIAEEEFPEIVKKYNSGGKAAAYEYLRDKYGIKQPYFVIDRIRRSKKYIYDSTTDQFSEQGKSSSEDIFMDLDELCGTITAVAEKPSESVLDTRPAAMEKLVHELIRDRLLMLSRYIVLDSSTRTILIDRTSLSADGYSIETH